MLAIVSQGNITTDGNEQTLVQDETNGVYSLGVDMNAMVASDVVEFRAYERIRTTGAGATYRLVQAVVTKTGSQSAQPHAKIFSGVEAPFGVKFTIKRTATGAGGDKTFPWHVSKIS